MKMNNRRVYPGMKQPAHKGKFRQDEAKERQAAYDKLTLQQKIDRLPPEPHAQKQRARLLALQVKQNQPAPVKEQATVNHDNSQHKSQRKGNRQ